ncbi:MAG: hypothetical protein V7K92_29930 [Nostoc sp.]|uniref:hypothetical protein n=1 Tax=Nostoc sp. TaxID=1180 RepID=UPI002FF15611
MALEQKGNYRRRLEQLGVFQLVASGVIAPPKKLTPQKVKKVQQQFTKITL